MLGALVRGFGGGPVGVSTLAVAVGEDPGTVEEVCEPFLVRAGLLARTPRGRVATEAGWLHLGKTPPSGVVQGDLFPLGGSLSFGWTLAKAPRVHVIAPGGTRPAGCKGTAAHPGARPGHLCIFERTAINVAKLKVSNAAGQGTATSSTFGAWLETFAKLGGNAQVAGSWAVAPR